MLPRAWATFDMTAEERTMNDPSPSAIDKATGSAYRSALEVIAASEPDVAAAITGELASQRRQLKLIASENYASPAVLLAMGNWLSDKYAEGTPGSRFYAGCEMVDRVETLAADHAKALFGADHAYVQPHSGIDANLVAYWAILANRIERPALAEVGAKNVDELEPAVWERLRHALNEQRMMGMSLDAGGHLTHGFRRNISGKLFEQDSYGTDPETGMIDYDAVAVQAREFRPLVLVAGGLGSDDTALTSAEIYDPATNSWSATASMLDTNVSLGEGPTSLFQPGGTSIVIHASLDDYKTDPAGNSGARIACGMIQK